MNHVPQLNMGQGFTVVIDFCFWASLCAASRRPRELVLQMVANRQRSEEDMVFAFIGFRLGSAVQVVAAS